MYSFYDWCIDNNRTDLLNLWDYNLNDKSPKDVAYKSNSKFYFLCPRGLHSSKKHSIQYFPLGKQKKLVCDKCLSFAQNIIDQYSEEYLNSIWSEKNTINPWEIRSKSHKKAIFNCINNESHVYEMSLINYTKGQKCPYCSHRKIIKEESLGYYHPDSLRYWSDKNKNSPWEFFSGSGKKLGLNVQMENTRILGEPSNLRFV